MNRLNTLSKYGPILLRYAMSLVVLWFGYSQLINPEMWMRVVPAWAAGMFDGGAATIIMMNGWFEIITGILLILGIGVRWVAFLLGLHLIGIASNFGLSPIGVRDWGLCLAMFGVFLNGADVWSLERKWSPSTS